MDDDWQETQQTTRHVHNRVNKGSKRHGGGKSGGTFDIKRVLGTYEVKCPAIKKLGDARHGGEVPESTMEIYTLNESGNAVLGELLLGGLGRVGVVLAGSRKVMSKVIGELEVTNEEGDGDEEEVEEEEEGSGPGVDKDDVAEDRTSRHGNDGDDNEVDTNEDGEEEDDDEEDEEDSKENRRFREFEKNSFRVPKFWMKWQGSILSHATDSDSSTSEQTVTGTGYLVFSGNHCNRYQGTLSCEALEWNNVKISGWKIRAHPARNFELTWKAE